MREQLLGYLIGALDEVEHGEVETCLKKDRRYQHELELLHESLEPLRAGEADLAPPAGLAARTCQAVAAHRAAQATAPNVVPNSSLEPLAAPQQWSFADMAVAAGIFLAAGMLLLPAIQQSRVIAQRTDCQNNLREIGRALEKFSETRNGLFPAIPAEGNQAVAGIFSLRLLEGGFLNSSEPLFCGSQSQQRGAEGKDQFRIPSSEELDQANGEQLVRLQRMLGGSYGYSLGHAVNGRYRPVRNRGRANFALVADAPCNELDGFRSSNHGGCGQNVLFEDGHVDYMKNCARAGCSDHIFLNDADVMAAGLHPDDAVIGHSWSQPLPKAVVYGAADRAN